MDKSLIISETGEIDWESIKKLSKESGDAGDTLESSDCIGYDGNQDGMKKFHCKKCNLVFYCKNYMGGFPLCDKHRNNTFKK